MKKFLKVIFFALVLFITFLRIIITVFPYEEVIEFFSASTTIPTEQFEYNEPYDRGIYIFSYIYHNTYLYVTAISFLSAIAGTFILYKGRTILEALMLFNFLAIPRQRKTWGEVFDEKSGKAVPLAVLRLYKKDENGLVNVGQGVSDFEGKYKLFIPNKDVSHKIEVMAEGYKPFSKELPPEIQRLLRGEVIEDIPLSKFEDNVRDIRTTLYSLRPKLYTYLLAYLFILSVANFLRSFYGVFIFPIAGSYIEASMYGIALIWNIFVIYERLNASSGRILDAKTGDPIKGAFINILLSNGEVAIFKSDELGTVHTNIAKGTYKASISLNGNTSNLSKDVLHEAKIDKNGYLNNNLYILLDESAQRLNNPFN